MWKQMWKQRGQFVVLFALALLPVAANATAATAAHWTVVTQPARLVNGTPVLFRVTFHVTTRVTTPTPVRTLSGTWLGHEISFAFDAKSGSWFTLAGVSQETKPGTYVLQLHAETADGQSAGKSAGQPAG